MTAFLASKVQRECKLAHLRGIRPCDARKSMRPCWLSPSTAFSYPDWVLSLLPSIMNASWARLGRVSSRSLAGSCDRATGGRRLLVIIVVLMAMIRTLPERTILV